MFINNLKNLFNSYRLYVYRGLCGLLASAIIIAPANVFAQANIDVEDVNADFNFSALDVSNYNYTLNLIFGQTETDEKYAAITAIYRGLANTFGPAYVYSINNNTYQSPASYFESQNSNRYLQAISSNQWWINQNLISIDSNTSGVKTKLDTIDTDLKNALYYTGYVGNQSYSVGTTSRNTAVNTQNINNALRELNWTGTLTGHVNTSLANSYSSDITGSISTGTDIYYTFQNTITFNEAYIFKFQLPMRYLNNGLWDQYTFDQLFTFKGVLVSIGPSSTIKGYTSYDLNYFVYNNGAGYDFYILNPSLFSSGSYVSLVFTAKQPINMGTGLSIKYLSSSSEDYYTLADYLTLRTLSTDDVVAAINNKQFSADISGDVTIDTSDIIDAIENLSLTQNDVQLNLTINQNTASDGSSVISRLQSFFNTGVSISDFFDEVDDAETGWFTQSNSDLINTLSGGYVDLYE